MFSAILAISNNNVIGKNNSLPWPHCKEDMQWFLNHTKNKITIMGSNTWYSLPKKPLPNRTNIVISNQPSENFIGADHVLKGDNIIQTISELYPNQEKIIIGGANVYRQFFPVCSKIYLTRFLSSYDGNIFLNLDILNEFNLVFNMPNFNYTFQVWERK